MLGKEQAPQNLGGSISDEALHEYYDKNYHQILPIIAEKVHQEKVQQEKLKAVKARLNFEESLRHSESGTLSRRRYFKERLGPRNGRRRSRSPKSRRNRSKSPKERGPEGRTVFKRLENGVRKAADKVLTPGKQKLLSRNIIAKEHPRKKRKHCQKVKAAQEVIGSQNQRSKSRALRMTYPNRGVWFDDLPHESIDSYDDLKKAFLENYLQQKKCIKDPVETHNIKQRDGESTEEFMRRYKLECRDVKKGAPECMKISRFMHGITNPELIKRLHDNIPKTKAKLRKGKLPEPTKNGAKDRFAFLTKTPKEILDLDKEKFKPSPPMTTQVEKRNASKFFEFHGEVRHTIDECMHLKRQIEEMLKAGKLSHLIKELKQNNGKDQKDKKRGNPKERQVAGNINGTTVAEDSKTENYLNFFSRIPSEGDEEYSTSTWMNFMVVRSPSLYNRIIGRPGVRKIRAIPSTAHGMLKFPVAGGIVTLRSSKIIPLECTMVSGPVVPQPVINQVAEEKIQVAIHPEYPEQTVAIGSTLIEEGRKELCGLLRRNLDIFAWKPADMTGVPRHIAEHRLNIREGCLRVRQKKRGQAPERNKAICEEVEKLVDVNIMKEVHCHSWLSNSVMVKKHDGSWRMCVDFKDLNKACLKDGYPLPEIDWKVESLCGYPFKCFLDAYKGYHQIKMAEEDKEKTAFITNQGIFCYSKMPFGLKNAGATYQRLVDKAF
ncbi:reverse transcriptase domain-containing protein [Tanacetum coccineum]